MRARRTVESNQVFRLPGGTEDNDLWVQMIESDQRVDEDDPCYGMPSITSVWVPNNEEREAIAMGANIELTLIGQGVPPLMMNTTTEELKGVG